MTATAAVTFAPSHDPGATVEVGDLDIDKVTLDGADLAFAPGDNHTLALALPARDAPATVTFAYRWHYQKRFDHGISKAFTLDWPTSCGNVFPCHSDPADGMTFSLSLANVEAGKTAVYAPAVRTPAPAYQLAWAVDDFTEMPLGTTHAGTHVSVWYRPDGKPDATAGSAHLLAAFDWFERTLGPYRFGDKFGVVSAAWPVPGGGIEHHPFVHVSTFMVGNEVVQIHEASHGWFGDGVRIACWEDFVLSEGTASYLAARALDVVAPEAGAAAWKDYATQLAALTGNEATWPDSCGKVDIIKDKLFNNAPYMRGAFFYRSVANAIGADKLDNILASFYAAHAGKAARMNDMIEAIHAASGIDAAACAHKWLRATTIPSAPGC